MTYTLHFLEILSNYYIWDKEWYQWLSRELKRGGLEGDKENRVNTTSVKWDVSFKFIFYKHKNTWRHLACFRVNLCFVSFFTNDVLDKHNPISKIQGRKWRLQNFEDEVFVSYLCTIPEWNRLPIPVAYANSIVHFETLVLPKWLPLCYW